MAITSTPVKTLNLSYFVNSAHETELLHTLSQADGIVSDPRLLMNGIMIKLTQGK
jgi:hypothetical protein